MKGTIYLFLPFIQIFWRWMCVRGICEEFKNCLSAARVELGASVSISASLKSKKLIFSYKNLPILQWPMNYEMANSKSFFFHFISSSFVCIKTIPHTVIWWTVDTNRIHGMAITPCLHEIVILCTILSYDEIFMCIGLNRNDISDFLSLCHNPKNDHNMP